MVSSFEIGRYVFDHSRGGDLPAFGYDRNV